LLRILALILTHLDTWMLGSHGMEKGTYNDRLAAMNRAGGGEPMSIGTFRSGAAVATAGLTALLFMPATAHAATTNVPCDPTALNTTITNASSGSILVLAPGCTYTYTDLSKANANDALPPIAKTLTIVGNGAVIQRSPTAADFRIVEIDSGGSLALNSLTIRNGHAPASLSDGGGVFVNGSNARLDARNAVTITQDVAQFGGGIEDLGGALNLNNSTISHSTAGRAGGGLDIFRDGATATLNSSFVTDNTSNFSAGGIEAVNSVTVTLNSTSVTGNTASAPGSDKSAFGAGISNDSPATLNLNSVRILNNTATGTGGGAFAGGLYNSGTVTFSSGQLSNNSAEDSSAGGRGGGLYNAAGSSTLRSIFVTQNQALGPGADGGGIFRNSGTVPLISTLVRGNTPNNCGGTVPGCTN
jgi:hypothetical protein